MAKMPATSLGVLAAKEIRAGLRAHLRTRNGICHGLEGVSAAKDGKPAMLTWTIEGETCAIAWDDLQASFAWLSRVPRAISMISHASSDRIGNRFSDCPDNRAWWLSEFGLDLTDGVVGRSVPATPRSSGPELEDPGASMHPPTPARP